MIVAKPDANVYAFWINQWQDQRSALLIVPDRNNDQAFLFEGFLVVSRSESFSLEEVLTDEWALPVLIEARNIVWKAEKPQPW